MQTKETRQSRAKKRKTIVLIEKIIIEIVFMLMILAMVSVIKNIKDVKNEQIETITVVGSKENVIKKPNFETTHTKTVTKATNSEYYHPDIEFIALPVQMNEELQRIVFELSEENGISYIMVIALIEHESGFDPEIVSETNDTGLMQINAINAGTVEEALGVTNLKDPEENIKAGIYLFSQLAAKYEVSEALMAYNMGETGAAKLWAKGIYESTYSKEITDRAYELSRYVDNLVIKGE